jgi:hypothetical protein
MTPTKFCPTCGRAELGAPGTPRPAMTAEFPAVTDPEEAAAAATPMPYAGSDRCSWCGKPAGEVKKLITGPGVQICNECVAFCALILRDEEL